VAMIAVGGDDGVGLIGRGLGADDDGFLADVEVAETADQAHAVHLSGLFLEPADQQHLPVMAQNFICIGVGNNGGCRRLAPAYGCFCRLGTCNLGPRNLSH